MNREKLFRNRNVRKCAFFILKKYGTKVAKVFNIIWFKKRTAETTHNDFKLFKTSAIF